MLVVGGGGRNLGKTEFLCRLIEMQSRHAPVTALKVTAFDGDVKPGKDYLDFEGDFSVTLEKQIDDDKDTHRMYRAGATRVYWLRTKRDQLSKGLEHLFDRMDSDGTDVNTACLVAEGLCIRTWVEPGLFFIIRDPESAMKPSCDAVLHLADSLLLPLGVEWSPLLDRLAFSKGSWGLQ